MQKKKLAIFITSMGKGGAEKVVSTLLSYLKNYFELYLVLLNDTVVYDLPKEVNIIYLQNNKSNNIISKVFSILNLVYKYKTFCKQNKIDISLSLLSEPNFISLVSKIIGNNSKIIISVHIGLSQWREKEIVYSITSKFLIKIFYNIANKIIVVSKIIKQDLIQNYNIKKDKISVIYNPHNLDKINKLKHYLIDDNISFSDKITLISIGTLNERKGFKNIIKAFSKLNNKNIQLIILGEGELKLELLKMIQDLKLEKNIHILGFKTNPYKYLYNSDIFILASDNEGLPNVIIEALACNCAVISTDCISGPREILAPNSNLKFQQKDIFEKVKYGILTPVNDSQNLSNAIKYLLDNSNELERFKAIGSTRAYNFNIDQQCNEYLINLNKEV